MQASRLSSEQYMASLSRSLFARRSAFAACSSGVSSTIAASPGGALADPDARLASSLLSPTELLTSVMTVTATSAASAAAARRASDLDSPARSAEKTAERGDGDGRPGSEPSELVGTRRRGGSAAPSVGESREDDKGVAKVVGGTSGHEKSSVDWGSDRVTVGGGGAEEEEKSAMVANAVARIGGGGGGGGVDVDAEEEDGDAEAKKGG